MKSVFLEIWNEVISNKEIVNTLGFSYEEINDAIINLKKDK